MVIQSLYLIDSHLRRPGSNGVRPPAKFFSPGTVAHIPISKVTVKGDHVLRKHRKSERSETTMFFKNSIKLYKMSEKGNWLRSEELQIIIIDLRTLSIKILVIN